MMFSTLSVYVISLLLFLSNATQALVSTTSLCNEREREALLQFKQALRAPGDILSSWVGFDCCKWEGVGCNNITGHVTELKLHYISGEIIDSSLLELKHLSFLDLSGNIFQIPIPEFFGSMNKLKYLNLSYSFFSAKIPHQLGNISSLTHLDLSNNDLKVDNLDWVAHLSHLEHLNMEHLNLSGIVGNELQIMNKLPSLSVLYLSNCGLREFPTLSNLTSLTSLDLSSNSITSKFPDWLVELHSLVDLDLSSNSLKGPIPSDSGRLCNLQRLQLSKNNMDGEIYGFLENLTRCGKDNSEEKGRFLSIRSLDFSYNNFSGTMPESMGTLSELVVLRMLQNPLEGVLSEAHFFNLTKLESLDLSSNSFVLNISRDWVAPFKLKFIHLHSCHLGPQFPMWLRFQKDYIELDISNAQISDAFPDWFWSLSSQVAYLNISQNKINGRLPTSLNFANLEVLDLSSNQFEGPLPYHVSGAAVLDFSSNLFSGPIILNFSFIQNELQYVSLSNNQLNGSIPSSFCNSEIYSGLDLSKNNLSGQIPNCWENSVWLGALDLSYNNLSGRIPTFAHGPSWLQLSYNSFSGTFPFLEFPEDLISLDLSNNRLSGSIPTWVGEVMSNLMILNLRSNMFNGNIPPQLAKLPSLQILDLADNRLSGVIPSTFGNFTGMKIHHNLSYGFLGNTSKHYEESIVLIMKRLELEYTKTLRLVTAIDLSSNNLSGEIPKELASLHQLQSLNLSGNDLAGKIPENIGELQQLESLDLSRNHLSGKIPSSISKLNFLGSLNLSYNDLFGRIPSGNQIQTLVDPSIYVRNRDLCGPPISKTCPGEEVSQAPKAMDGGDGHNVTRDMWFYLDVWSYVSMALGFVVGFWGFCVPLLLCKPWRIAYYRFLDHPSDWFYVLFFNMVVEKIRKK